jgi:hypothetical protein
VTNIESCISAIRDYTQKHQELREVTLFSYDVLLPKPAACPVEIAVFGINEAEYPDIDGAIRSASPAILEDTSLNDFRQRSDELGRKAQETACKWYRRVRAHVGENVQCVLGEFFFWSSRDTAIDFVRRYGSTFEKAFHHLEFCRDLNFELLRCYKPRIVVALNLTHEPLLSTLYHLKQDRVPTPYCSDGRTLVVIRHDGKRPWLFVRHPRSFGLTNIDRSDIRKIIILTLTEERSGCCHDQTH